MVAPKEYRKLREKIESDPQAYLNSALAFLGKRLRWVVPENTEIIIRRLELAEFVQHHPSDRLAGEIEAIVGGKNVHFVHFNWRKLINTGNQAFVFEYIFCLVHELLEIYGKQSGERKVHLEPNKDQATPEETDMTYSFLEEELGLPRSDYSGFQWRP